MLADAVGLARHAFVQVAQDLAVLGAELLLHRLFQIVRGTLRQVPLDAVQAHQRPHQQQRDAAQRRQQQFGFIHHRHIDRHSTEQCRLSPAAAALAAL